MANSLGDRIRTLRERAGLTQKELSDKINISNTTLSQYENGRRTPSDEIKMSLAAFFDVSINYLFGQVEGSGNKNIPLVDDRQGGEALVRALKQVGLLPKGSQLTEQKRQYLLRTVRNSIDFLNEFPDEKE